jgi:hypothetical protein
MLIRNVDLWVDGWQSSELPTIGVESCSLWAAVVAVAASKCQDLIGEILLRGLKPEEQTACHVEIGPDCASVEGDDADVLLRAAVE